MQLREIADVRQETEGVRRRWFTSDAMDLIVWVDDCDQPSGFQFCYERGTEEFALSWFEESGLSHVGVDDGETDSGLQYKATPVLTTDSELDTHYVRALFANSAHAVPETITRFILEHIDTMCLDD